MEGAWDWTGWKGIRRGIGQVGRGLGVGLDRLGEGGVGLDRLEVEGSVEWLQIGTVTGTVKGTVTGDVLCPMTG